MLSTATSRPDDRIASEDNAAAVTTFAASLDALSPTVVLRAPNLHRTLLSFFARGTKDEFLRFEPSSFAPSPAANTRHTPQASNGADAVRTASDGAAPATRPRHRSKAAVVPHERRSVPRGAGAAVASSTVTAASRDGSAAAHADSGSRSPDGGASSAARRPADRKRKRNREVPDAKLVEQAVGSLSQQQLPAEPPLEKIRRTSMWDLDRLLDRAVAGAVETQARGISAVSVIGSMVREHGGDEDEFVRAGRILGLFVLHFYESFERSIRGRSAKDRGGRASTKAYAELSEMINEKAEELKRKNCETKKLMILAIELGLGRIIEISQKGSNV
ncbi:uncharacterized protein K452DRAFT_312438 [Neofusicoccum parvum]|uniref:Uncharacterized protein K452DRAFT_312438 n=1 Tax=Neofusicoccum parvum TaxID=310453 RepID=A0ACB5SL02_9PEZI|nr:uncharacterized protein K452DRAFT_312438 [Neofusicoccum parvum]